MQFKNGDIKEFQGIKFVIVEENPGGYAVAMPSSDKEEALCRLKGLKRVISHPSSEPNKQGFIYCDYSEWTKIVKRREFFENADYSDEEQLAKAHKLFVEMVNDLP